MTTTFRGAVVLGCACAAFLFTGGACVKDDAVITGMRDAGVSDARGLVPIVVPAADDPDDDAPDCRRCGETLNTDTARGTLCRKNGDPSSVRRLSAVVDCVCYDKCVQECASYCAGARQDEACFTCIGNQCAQPINACMADRREGT